jgi:hypothetical protein
MTASLYGEFQSEKLATESQVAREIVREINNFGINERQRWLIIHSLALELENHEDMRELIGFIKETKGDSLFLSTIKEG